MLFLQIIKECKEIFSTGYCSILRPHKINMFSVSEYLN